MGAEFDLSTYTYFCTGIAYNNYQYCSSKRDNYKDCINVCGPV